MGSGRTRRCDADYASESTVNGEDLRHHYGLSCDRHQEATAHDSRVITEMRWASSVTASRALSGGC
ncbi:hypothetical protein CIW52_29920 [Mycolicibacterium sp. P9-64]|nr:hypothetical protein CIW52_29920 [Mycolicibacterium sp. P9-64]